MTPDEFIEISDFRPGIWSDMHASDYSAGVPIETGDGIRGYLPGNGAATIQNTHSCRADKTGALIPLPRQNFAPDVDGGTDVVTAGIPTDDYTPQFRLPQRNAAYVLDAEISPLRFYNEINYPWDKRSFSLYVLWGFLYAADGLGLTNGYYPYILGREYRQANAFGQDVYDFMFCRQFARLIEPYFLPLPIGSLTVSRVDWNATRANVAANGVRFDLSQTTPVIVALGAFRNSTDPEGNAVTSGDVPAAEEAWLTSVPVPPGGGATVKKPTTYTPMIFVNGWQGRNSPTMIGMSFGRQHFDVNAPPNGPIDEWKWHQRDEMNILPVQNAPYSPNLVISHQGRVVMPDEVGRQDFEVSVEFNPSVAGERAIYFAQDILWYSQWALPIGEVYTHTDTFNYMTSYTPLQVAEDVTARIGVLGVTTADELLAVKAFGGGVVIRGDLDNPTVRRLPHIEPTYGVVSKGVASPIGFVYGTRTGVFVFDGGDTTRKLSRQIDGFFWDVFDPTEDSEFEGKSFSPTAGSHGRFAYWAGMVHAPNNYIYDIETDSWWRWRTDWSEFLPAPIHKYGCYLVTPLGDLWAIPYKVTTTAANPVAVYHAMNETSLAYFYSWQSQPLVETRGRRLSFQDVRLLVTADAVSTITVTITGRDERGNTIATDDIVLTTTAQREPQLLREDITSNFVAEYAQVRIQAVASTANRAPKIHSLRLGIKPRQTTPRHG